MRDDIAPYLAAMGGALQDLKSIIKTLPDDYAEAKRTLRKAEKDLTKQILREVNLK